MCRLLGVSKQAYYKHVDKLMFKLARESFVIEFIKEVRQKAPGIGGNKLWLMYRRRFGEEDSVGYNRFYDIIERYGLKVRKRRRRIATTDSNHDLPLYPNLVKELIPSRPCQVIVSDITYIPLWVNPVPGHRHSRVAPSAGHERHLAFRCGSRNRRTVCQCILPG